MTDSIASVLAGKAEGCIVQVRPLLEPRVRGLCRCSYPNHPHGCPNYGRKFGCPPQAPELWQILDLDNPVYAIWSRFALGEHRRKMQEKHPDWTRRQLDCCLYWQPKARQVLEQRIMDFWWSGHQDLTVVRNPEGAGVNVTATMASVGIQLEWPPDEWAYQVALAGTGL